MKGDLNTSNLWEVRAFFTRWHGIPANEQGFFYACESIQEAMELFRRTHDHGEIVGIKAVGKVQYEVS